MSEVLFLAPRDNHDSTAHAVGTFGRQSIQFGHFGNNPAGWLECARTYEHFKIGDVVFIDVTDYNEDLVERPPMLAFMENYAFAPCAVVYVLFDAPDGRRVVLFYDRPNRTFVELHRFPDTADWKTIFKKIIELFGEMDPAPILRRLLQRAMGTH